MQPPDNPYEVPNVVDEATVGPAAPNERAMFAQLQVVGILQVVAGGMELLVATLYACTTAFYLFVNNDGGDLFGGGPQLLLLIYASIWGGVSISGCLRIASGIGSFYYRYRTLMLVSLVLGFVSVLTCYCAATAVPIGIYGLVVMLSPTAARAYAMRRAGLTPTQIRDAFNR